jgi:hypothetical protein
MKSVINFSNLDILALENILSYLSTEDIFTFRLLNHDYFSFVTPYIKKNILLITQTALSKAQDLTAKGYKVKYQIVNKNYMYLAMLKGIHTVEIIRCVITDTWGLKYLVNANTVIVTDCMYEISSNLSKDLDLTPLNGVQNLIISYCSCITQKSNLEMLDKVKNIEIYACSRVGEDTVHKLRSCKNIQINNEVELFLTKTLLRNFGNFIYPDQKTFLMTVTMIQIEYSNFKCKTTYEKSFLFLQLLKTWIYFRNEISNHPDLTHIIKNNILSNYENIDKNHKTEATKLITEIDKYIPLFE